LKRTIKLLLVREAGGVWLFVRLPGGRCILVDCGCPDPSRPLRLLRQMGELGPLSPLEAHLRPLLHAPSQEEWLAALGLLRAVVFRPGGAWILWQPEHAPSGGFALRARVVARSRLPSPPPQPGLGPPMLAIGLSPQQVMALGGPPQAWVCNASLALYIPGMEESEPGLVVGGDLRARAWQTLLGELDLAKVLAGAGWYAAGSPAEGYTLARAMVSAVLPWLVLGWVGRGGWPPKAWEGPVALSTPAVGMVEIVVEEEGNMLVRASPWAESLLFWEAVARPVSDPALPAPWPLRRALAGG